MTETTLQLSDVERLATALESVDLDDRDRVCLHAVFALAGLAAVASGESDVTGFALQSPTFGVPTIATGPDLLGSFTGGHKPGTQGGIEVHAWEFGVTTPDS